MKTAFEDILAGFERLRAAAARPDSEAGLLEEIDALERTVFAAIGAVPPHERPRSQCADPGWRTWLGSDRKSVV
jgi:hypothetical protein